MQLKTEPREPPKVQPESATAESEPPARRLPSAERARRLLAERISGSTHPYLARLSQWRPQPTFRCRPTGRICRVSHSPGERPSCGGFMVQLGSFRKLSDADRMKANLALTDTASLFARPSWRMRQASPRADRAVHGREARFAQARCARRTSDSSRPELGLDRSRPLSGPPPLSPENPVETCTR